MNPVLRVIWRYGELITIHTDASLSRMIAPGVVSLGMEEGYRKEDGAIPAAMAYRMVSRLQAFNLLHAELAFGWQVMDSTALQK